MPQELVNNISGFADPISGGRFLSALGIGTSSALEDCGFLGCWLWWPNRSPNLACRNVCEMRKYMFCTFIAVLVTDLQKYIATHEFSDNFFENERFTLRFGMKLITIEGGSEGWTIDRGYYKHVHEAMNRMQLIRQLYLCLSKEIFYDTPQAVLSLVFPAKDIAYDCSEIRRQVASAIRSEIQSKVDGHILHGMKSRVRVTPCFTHYATFINKGYRVRILVYDNAHTFSGIGPYMPRDKNSDCYLSEESDSESSS